MSRVATLVAAVVADTPARQRPARLMEIIRHAAAGLEVIHGDEKAAEALYELADHIATRRNG